MKKFFGSFAAVLSVLAALLLGSTATANATGASDATCVQNSVTLLVVCDIDFDVIVLEDPDVVVEIKEPRLLTDNEINVLENAFKNADILNGTTIDLDALKNVVVNVHKSFNPSIDLKLGDITTFLCALQVHAHCH